MVFLFVLRERLIDCRWQHWASHVQESERFDMYRLFNPSHCIPVYLSMKMNRHLRQIMSRFRFGISDLAIHHYRYSSAGDHCYTCPLCKEAEDNEIHFVLICPVISDIRRQYIPYKFYRQPCLFRYTLLMTATNMSIVRNLANFLYRAFKFRDVYLS